MPRVKCPRCATIVETVPGVSPVCPVCGFGGPAPAAAAPMAPPPPPPPMPAAQSGWMANAPPAFSAPPPMGRAERPGWVTFVGVYYVIAAVFLCLIGVIALFAGSIVAAAFEGGWGEFGDAIAAIVAVVGVFLLAFGILAVFIAMGIFRGRPWARMTAMVLSILGIVFGVLGAVADVVALNNGAATGSPGGGVLGLVLDVLVLVALTRPASKAYFGLGPPAPM